jgi:hypothetical protein
MRIPLEHCHRVCARGTVVCLTLVAFLAAAAPARAQYVEIQSFEVTPFVGARLGGTFDIQPDGAAPIEGALKDAASYGFSAGVRFDDLSLVEFRWTQATSTLRFGAPFAFLAASVGDVTLNQFHADFLGSWLAIRAEAQWLPIVVEPSVSGFACGTIQLGGCLVVLNGELVQQFQLSIGPVVRF